MCDPFCMFSSVQSLSRVWLFATPWIAARQASLSITKPQSPPKPMSIESVMPSNHLILVIPFSSCPQSFPASGSFQMNQLFTSGGQSIGVSASTSGLPMNTQDWCPLGWTGWISLQGLSRVFSNTTVQNHRLMGGTGCGKKMGLALVDRAMLSKSLIRLSSDGCSCAPSLFIVWPKVMQFQIL